MASRLNPYLSFQGNARQAMEFYQSVLGGELTVNTFGEFGTDDPALADQIMHSLLTTPSGFVLMASDTPPGMEHTPGSTVTVSLSGDDPVLRDYWAGLSAGGTVTVPFEKQMWGDEFGACVDQFGVPWMVDLGAPQA
jgi:PhnB protein